MKVALQPWDGRLDGLGEAEDWTLWEDTLGQAAAAAVRRAGMELVEDLGDGPGLLLPAGAAVGPELLRAAALAGQEQGRSLRFRLGGRTGALMEQLTLGLEAPPLRWRDQGEELEWELDPVERELPQIFPDAELALSDRLYLPVRHPLQLLWANLLGLPPWLWGRLVGRGGLMPGLRLGWAALRAGSTNPERVAAQLNRVGEGAQVHPRAVVEGCVLGVGARVEAGAVVRGCVLGAGARVEANAVCEASVLGAGAVVQRQATSRFNLLCAGAMLGGVTQLSVLGPKAQLKLGAFGMDQGLSQGVRVLAGGVPVQAPLGLAGVVLGRDSLVGSGVWIAPGRLIPAGVRLIAPGALSDPRLPDAGGRDFVVRDGRLEAL